MSFGEVVDGHEQFSSALSALRLDSYTGPEGNRAVSVAVSFRATHDLVLALAMLDGTVERILLLPPSTEHDTAVALLERAGVTTVYGDSCVLEQARPLREISVTSGQHETEWLLATSGTTGAPKLVAHTFMSLTRTARRGGRGHEFVWGQIYDDYRFAGLQVILQALVGGSRIVAPDKDLALCRKLAAFAEGGVNALSATPTLWRKILMVEGSRDLNLRSITLGGEIVDQHILDALRRRYPDARIRHIYASTEAGASFSVSDGLAGFPASFLVTEEGEADLKIIDGSLFIRNPHVGAAYVGESAKRFKDDAGFVDTGDLVSVDGDRVFFLGRRSGLINVGGNKVLPEVVENVLTGIEGVAMASVFGKGSAITGQLVMADIVAEPDTEPAVLEKKLRLASKEQLEPHQRPALYRFVDSIETSANGKLVRS